MRRKIFTMALAILPIAGFIACDDDQENNETPVVKPVSNTTEVIKTGESDCLGNPYSLNKGDDIIYAYCDIAYDAKKDQLKLIVSNIAFYCEAKTYLSASFNNDKIKVEVSDSSKYYAKCDCLYSDTIVMQGFEKRNYTLDVYNMHYMNSTNLELGQNSDIEKRIYIDKEVAIAEN